MLNTNIPAPAAAQPPATLAPVSRSGAAAEQGIDLRALLPRLRRHALLVLNDMAAADRSLAACLGSLPRTAISRRLDLFRHYHDTLRAAPKPGLPASAPAAHPLAGLAGLNDTARQMLSLVAVERFSVAEAAHVLDLPLDQAAALLLRARADLAA